MANKTGRKNIADPAIRQRALSIAKANPGMKAPDIANRLVNVSTRQVQYWLTQDRKKGKGAE